MKLDEDYVLPAEGVYAAYVHYNGEKYRAVVNFGNNPTFPGSDYSIEAHIMGFPERELYCEHLSIRLVQRIRGEMTLRVLKNWQNRLKKIFFTQKIFYVKIRLYK